jgi:hypothetical protein
MQALNIFFATCGITGATYGIGQKFADLAPEDIKTALLVWILLSDITPTTSTHY